MAAVVVLLLSLVGSLHAASVVDTLVAEPSASTLVGLVNTAGLASALASSEVTVFAPTDAAFAKLPPATLTSLQNNVTALAELLKYHVVSGTVPSSAITADLSVASLAGDKIRLNAYGNGKATANGAVISSPDHKADNGMIHYIDDVIMPPTQTLEQMIRADPQFSTLVTALDTAGLHIPSNGSFTLFAPTNDAFAKLAKSDLEKLLKENPPIHLVNMLEYHLLDTAVFSAGMFNHEYEQSVDAAHDRVHIRVTPNSDVMINSALVTDADHVATNGALHVIDRTLIPVRVGFWLRTGHGGVGK